MKNEILNYLKADPRFRERKNKNKGLANLVMQKYGIEIPKDKRDDFIADILGADRSWRRCLEEDESLRGSDYAQGDILAQEKKIQLGYVPFTCDQKELENYVENNNK
jgi:hypothetical protein